MSENMTNRGLTKKKVIKVIPKKDKMVFKMDEN